MIYIIDLEKTYEYPSVQTSTVRAVLKDGAIISLRVLRGAPTVHDKFPGVGHTLQDVRDWLSGGPRRWAKLGYGRYAAEITEEAVQSFGSFLDVCETCGSHEVEHAFFVDVNTDEVYDIFGSWCAGDNSWCRNCGTHRGIVRRQKP